MVLFTSSLAGYVFAKYQFFGKNVLFTMLLASMMIPFQVMMIPLYLILVRLGITDSLMGLIVPGATSAFGIFLMRQFIESIPSELIDAARIDGAAEFGIYSRIILPQMGPALATLGHFHVHGHLERLPVAADCDHHQPKSGRCRSCSPGITPSTVRVLT